MLRSVFIALSKSHRVRAIAEHSRFGQRLSRRFVAGRTLQELIATASAMNAAGVRATVDYLGENVTNPDAALRSEGLYHELLDEIARRKLQANVSLKLTHLGLDVNESLAHRTVEELLEHAVATDNFIRVDMESSAYTQRTLDLVRDLHRRPGAAGHIGAGLQAY
jgi:proline dehydrogenase